MAVDRRSLLTGAVAATAALSLGGGTALARERKRPPDDATGMLYDATRCVGCKTCEVACRKANNLAPAVVAGLWDAPGDLSANTKNVIRLYQEGDKRSFMKAQCMQCIDPACASACMMGSYAKREKGIVTWVAERCIGCRYCQIACPYNVPKFEWNAAVPKMVKCEMCRERLAEGREPACTEVCPREAIVYGDYQALLAEAHRRIDQAPNRYEPKVYGERDGGGTQVLYLSAAGIPFEKLGLPKLGDEGVAALPEKLQHGIYKGFIAPAALYVALGAVMIRNRIKGGKAGEEVGHE